MYVSTINIITVREWYVLSIILKACAQPRLFSRPLLDLYTLQEKVFYHMHII